MEIRGFLLRGAMALALAVAVAGSSIVVPSAQAMALSNGHDATSTVMKKKDGKSEEDEGDGGGGGFLGNVPIIGDAVGGMKGNSPGQTIRNVLETLDGVADSVVPSLLNGMGK